jgi:hypothetical protein
VPSYDLTELVAGPWQLRPWPAAYADLDEVLAERYPDPAWDVQREARMGGWERGDLLGFAVREITGGTCAAEVLVIVTRHGSASIGVWTRPDQVAARLEPEVTDVVRRWATGALELTLR